MQNRKRFWPIHFGFNRCTAFFWDDRHPNRCNKLLWPWQNVIYDPEPDSFGKLHHECYHEEVKSLWMREERAVREVWQDYLWCEHKGKLDAEASLKHS